MNHLEVTMLPVHVFFGGVISVQRDVFNFMNPAHRNLKLFFKHQEGTIMLHERQNRKTPYE